MQCNTNYTASLDNFKYINLNVLKEYKNQYPEVILGLSDHTPGHATVLGAITLGARVIEKHFTDNITREGPDHKFSMNPKTWSKMIEVSRQLEQSLGNGLKKLEKNEEESVIVQRRGVWAKKNLYKNEKLKLSDLKFLRPCPKNSISPFYIKKYIGKKIKRDLKINTLITKKCLDL